MYQNEKRKEEREGAAYLRRQVWPARKWERWERENVEWERRGERERVWWNGVKNHRRRRTWLLCFKLISVRRQVVCYQRSRPELIQTTSRLDSPGRQVVRKHDKRRVVSPLSERQVVRYARTTRRLIQHTNDCAHHAKRHAVCSKRWTTGRLCSYFQIFISIFKPFFT